MAFKAISLIPGTNIQAAEYDEESKTLRIRFVRGDRTYEYPGVDATTANGFSTSGLSSGQFFRANILNRYPAIEVT